MKPRQKRVALIAIAGVLITSAIIIVLNVFNDNLVFFYSPSEILERNFDEESRQIRLGGMVVPNSVQRRPTDTTVSFQVTDNRNTIKVTYTGILPDLFREGKGVVVQGRFTENQMFVANQVLAKHDENYMPPEVAEILKEPKKANIR